MKGKKILLGISGSIAAYKCPLLLRLLIKSGAEVKVVTSPSALDFVSPLVLSTLSKNEILSELASDSAWANHVALGRWADVMILAPASCNTIAKMANGICDNLLLSVYLSATCPVIIAPAMDEDMWNHASLKNNLNTLIGFGNKIIASEFGELASGLVGYGRMAEPETIFEYLVEFFSKGETLIKRKALITAGPTYENIDPVRYIGNHSSGKMGMAIAEALANRGCEVHLVLGPSALSTEHPGIYTTNVRSAEDMYQACITLFPEMDLAIMSAAVADYTPIEVAAQKIKKKETDFTLHLKKTKDILKQLGTLKTEKQLLIGFALESQNEKEYALGKLNEKNADAIIMNSLNDQGAGFAVDTNKVTLFEKNGEIINYPLMTKKILAENLCDKITDMLVKIG